MEEIIKQYKDIAENLSAWYEKNQRDLPWRRTRDPYRIWISEIMAQQTRIAALIPFYERFITRFPSIDTLAEADIEEVLALWAGLGYYSRAHNLHKSAQKINNDFSGVFPEDLKVILSLPGIGEYTAGAIASIAYGKPVPAIDGNVKRVYARVMLDEADTTTKVMKDNAMEFVSKLMPHAEPSVLTQALMELGALVCVPKNPDCDQCPLGNFCSARIEGRQLELPSRKKKNDKKLEKKTLILVRNPMRAVLMRKRTEKLLHGMYQYVLLDGHLCEDEVVKKMEEWGLIAEKPCDTKGYRHVFTHLIWDMKGYCCKVKGDLLDKGCSGYRFYTEAEQENIAIPRAFIWLEREIKDCK